MSTGTLSRDLYHARDRVDLVDVPEQLTVYVDGNGPVTGAEFATAARLLYGVSHAVHLLVRSIHGEAPDVMPLEALWWRPAGARDWGWHAFVAQPEPIDEALLQQVLARGRRSDSPLRKVGISRWHEGLSAQVLDGGSGAAIPPVVGLHCGIAGLGCRLRGRHHEIYLADPRRTTPSGHGLILRQPVVLDVLAS